MYIMQIRPHNDCTIIILLRRVGGHVYVLKDTDFVYLCDCLSTSFMLEVQYHEHHTDEKENTSIYYMTLNNVFSDWLTSLVAFFDKTLYSPRAR